MGDTGSLTIGMILCILCLRLLQYSTTEASAELPNILVLAYSPLLIPCLDVVRVYLHRVRNGKIHFTRQESHSSQIACLGNAPTYGDGEHCVGFNTFFIM